MKKLEAKQIEPLNGGSGACDKGFEVRGVAQAQAETDYLAANPIQTAAECFQM